MVGSHHDAGAVDVCGDRRVGFARPLDRRTILKVFQLLFPQVSSAQLHRLLNARMLHTICVHARNKRSLLHSQTLRLLSFLVSVRAAIGGDA